MVRKYAIHLGNTKSAVQSPAFQNISLKEKEAVFSEFCFVFRLETTTLSA
jgi:hypothetical protein